jgi:hypothetical protein
MEKGSMFSDVQAIALSALALISLSSARPTDALALADRGLQASAYPSEESILRLTRIEALRALGSMQEAHAALREALERVHCIADAIDDPELRESYLANIEANARIVSLAAEWLGREATQTPAGTLVAVREAFALPDAAYRNRA